MPQLCLFTQFGEGNTRIYDALNGDEKSIIKEVLHNIRFFVMSWHGIDMTKVNWESWQGIKMTKVKWEIAINLGLPMKIFKT